ncbi:MAG: AGE family epimerase/isomerase, partial [Verrucomicrobiota bacterium]
MNRRAFLRQASVGLAACLPARLRAASRPDFSAEAATWRRLLADRVLPWWLRETVDPAAGGYRLAHDAVQGAQVPSEKQVVTQARLVWGFSRAHSEKLGGPARDYLAAAAHGVKFLRERLRDPRHDGYYWSTHPDGSVLDSRKRVYGQAFVIYGLVEYFRASGDRGALDEARHLFGLLQRRAHDAPAPGWAEHFEADWTPMPPRDPGAIVEVAGLKSANTHLHLMEAFTELFLETRDPAVRRALEESLRLNQRHFYPADPARSAFHFERDWKPVTEPSSAGLSYGHNVEFAWLMIRAEEALGHRPSWRHFHAHLEHALRCGTDRVRGGVYQRGEGNLPATDTRKVWWVQAEMLAALTDGLRHQPGHQ